MAGRHIVILGGGTAGRLCAAILSRHLAPADPAGMRIMVESADIPTIGGGARLRASTS